MEKVVTFFDIEGLLVFVLFNTTVPCFLSFLKLASQKNEENKQEVYFTTVANADSYYQEKQKVKGAKPQKLFAYGTLIYVPPTLCLIDFGKPCWPPVYTKKVCSICILNYIFYSANDKLHFLYIGALSTGNYGFTLGWN